MPEASYLALFLVGLLGGTHCVGMCGGIVGALSMGGARFQLHLAYNLGRILSYATAGAIVGALGQMSISLAGQWPLRNLFYLVANLMLIALGLYLIGVQQILGIVESLGQSLWRRLQPLGRHLLPVRTVGQAFPVGMLWGWLPCGLVYSALATALSSGSSWQGALLMLAFGAGTLPNLLLAGLLAARLRDYTQQPVVRWLAGGLIGGYGVWGLLGSGRWLLST
ncbi:MAG TPA: sulfite exporter TauE/SafE family protein [Accumulibacter sp.]|nr:sulfite exporter TauE/SafE family protein [Accumulibacter sp.]HMW17771.1 sulfite exporter TauE/SafE family protein [Accumulibacter sp.]HMX22277.1 sulfite exporter TauE/SafE family protein [Accumulibacter sp.]HMY05640.1 sulfite exporter TauE/SafE family protein [Accumulibacter sp.]HNC17897.1 sulfite exporter TauE/SafE family protein [Accumulibacter sp.]